MIIEVPRHSEALQLWQCPGTVEHCSCGSALHNGALQLWQCPAQWSITCGSAWAQWSIAAVAVPCTMEHCLGTMEHCSCGSALHNGALQLWQCLATMEHCLWQCLVTMEHFLWQFLGTMEHCLWHSPGRPRFGYATETNPGFLLIFQDQHQALQQ